MSVESACKQLAECPIDCSCNPIAINRDEFIVLSPYYKEIFKYSIKWNKWQKLISIPDSTSIIVKTAAYKQETNELYILCKESKLLIINIKIKSFTFYNALNTMDYKQNDRRVTATFIKDEYNIFMIAPRQITATSVWDESEKRFKKSKYSFRHSFVADSDEKEDELQLLHFTKRKILMLFYGNYYQRLKYDKSKKFRMEYDKVTYDLNGEPFYIISQDEEKIIVFCREIKGNYKITGMYLVGILELKNWTLWNTTTEEMNKSNFYAICMDSGEMKYLLINGYFRNCYKLNTKYIATDLVHLIMKYYCDESIYYIDDEENLYRGHINTFYDTARSFSIVTEWF